MKHLAIMSILLVSYVAADDVIRPASIRFSNRDTQAVANFPKHVVPLLGRLGCKSAKCHVSIDESFVGPGYLGSRYSPLTADKPRHGMPYAVRGVSLADGLTIEKYNSQKKLLDDLDIAFRGFEDLDDQVLRIFRNKPIVVFGGGLFAWIHSVSCPFDRFKPCPVLAGLSDRHLCKSLVDITLTWFKRTLPAEIGIPIC